MAPELDACVPPRHALTPLGAFIVGLVLLIKAASDCFLGYCRARPSSSRSGSRSYGSRRHLRRRARFSRSRSRSSLESSRSPSRTASGSCGRSMMLGRTRLQSFAECCSPNMSGVPATGLCSRCRVRAGFSYPDPWVVRRSGRRPFRRRHASPPAPPRESLRSARFARGAAWHAAPRA